MKIDKKIKMPPQSHGRPAKYPFNKMKVGDSVFFEGEIIGPSCRPYNAALSWGRNNNAKFAGRTVNGGACIWRIE